MNEEELFCKLFPEYVVNGKPLSPYFDLFESGYEQAENRIEEFEQTEKGKVVEHFEAYGQCRDSRRIAGLEAQIEKLEGDLELWESGACRATNLDKCSVVKELKAQLVKSVYLMRELIINIDTPAYGYAVSQARKFIEEIKEK